MIIIKYFYDCDASFRPILTSKTVIIALLYNTTQIYNNIHAGDKCQ